MRKKKLGTWKVAKTTGRGNTPASLGNWHVDKSVPFTAECGCEYKYPDSKNGQGVGKPELVKPCVYHKPLPEPKHPQTRGRKIVQVGKFIGEIQGITRFHRDCEHCEGETVVDGDDKQRWIHGNRCPYTPMIWWHHGRTKEDWACPYGCPGQETQGGLTHNWQCVWWDSEYNPRAKTPF